LKNLGGRHWNTALSWRPIKSEAGRDLLALLALTLIGRLELANFSR
jgi:hypothetical protein